MIHDPARRADHHVRPAPQMAELEAHALAAVNGQDMKAGQMAGVALERLGHLDGQFAGGSQHQYLRLAVGQIQPLQQRQGEGGGLAGAGLRLADQVVAGEEMGDAGGLNRRWRFVADFLQGLQQRGRKRQFFKLSDGV